MFRDPEAAAETTQSPSGDVNYELVSPDGTPVFLSFSAPYVSLAFRDAMLLNRPSTNRAASNGDELVAKRSAQYLLHPLAKLASTENRGRN